MYLVTVRNFHFHLIFPRFKHLTSGMQVPVLQISSLQITGLQSLVCTVDLLLVVLRLPINLLLPSQFFLVPFQPNRSVEDTVLCNRDIVKMATADWHG